MKLRSLLGLFGVLILMTGCSHHRDVRAGADGVHRVVVKAEDADEGSRDAIAQANYFCESKYQKSAAFLEEKQAYTGDMKESDYKTAKTASKVAQGVGSAAWILGGRNESTAGGILGVGGSIARGAIGQGYTVDMRFRCQ